MKKLILIALLCTFTLSAQENLTVSIGQDVKLALYENDHDLKPFTTNPTLKVRLNGMQQELGYLTIGSFVEYADLSKNYRGYFVRYGVEGGYSFNQFELFRIPFEIRTLIGFGIINREFEVKGAGTYHFGSEIALNVFKWLNVTTDMYFLKRSDLENQKLQPTVKLGLEFKIHL